VIAAGVCGAGKTAAGECVAGKTAAGECGTGKTAAGECGTGKTAAGECGTGKTAAGECVAGKTAAGVLARSIICSSHPAGIWSATYVWRAFVGVRSRLAISVVQAMTLS